MTIPTPNNSKFYLLSLCAILATKALLIVGLILYSGIGLGPDEAQYWTWSNALDWGYYSKPPGIAWQIWTGSQFFGNTELGVRFPSIVLGTLLSLAVYFLARSCRLQPRTAFWAALIMALCPIGIMGSFLAITDGGMLLFWVLTFIVITKAIAELKTPNYFLIGILIAIGALFKWPIYLIWLLINGFMPFYRFLISPYIIVGFLISLLGLLPSVEWNYSHDWVTFRHVFTSVIGKQEGVSSVSIFQGNLLEFWGVQAVLVSPILFAMLLISFIVLIKNRKTITPPLFFCGASCLALLIAGSLLALFHKVQGNWAVYAYPAGFVFLSACAIESWKTGKRWVQIGLVLSLVLSVFTLSIPYMQSHNLSRQFPIPYKINPFRHNLGWDRLEQVLNQIGYDPAQHFLFGDKYQTSSILSFYSPGKKRAYFLNLHGVRLNQFSFWPSMAQEQLAQTGFFVLTENSPHLEKDLQKNIKFYEEELSKYFHEVHYIGLKPIFESNERLAKGALIFKCIDYNGKEPAKVDLY